MALKYYKNTKMYPVSLPLKGGTIVIRPGEFVRVDEHSSFAEGPLKEVLEPVGEPLYEHIERTLPVLVEEPVQAEVEPPVQVEKPVRKVKKEVPPPVEE